MPSDPYQSQFFRRLLRQTRHWLDRRQETVRQLHVATSWSAQILVYPVYALFQSVRSVGKAVGKAIQPDASSFLPTENLDEIEIPLQSAPLPFTAETALQQVFQVIDRFSLPERLPIGLELQTTRIRAIACLVETQALVLVTQANHILDVLTSQQQDELAQRIRWEVAAYGRFVKRWRSVPQDSLGESRHPKSLPDRVIGALQGGRSRLLRLLGSPAKKSLIPASGSLTIDAPVRQSMLAVRDCLAEIDLSSHLSPSQETGDSNLSAPASIFIRGVATQLEPRSLVLITNRNEILDILDADQQLILQQRIRWEVAHYCRYLRLRQGAAQLDPVRSPRSHSPVFPGVRPFYQLMAWMQQGSVAIATNLFKEADLADSAPGAVLPGLSFAQLRDRVIATLAPSRDRPERSLNAELTISGSTASDSPSSVTAANSTQMIPESTTQVTTQVQRSLDIATIENSPILEAIDTEATLMGYEQSLMERVMRILDFCFFNIEEFIRLLWNGLLKLMPKR